MTPHLTAIVLTRGDSPYLRECLAALAFCDARLLFASGTTPDTAQRAANGQARLVVRPFEWPSALGRPPVR
ncbi:MAG: hypothetical protein MUC99_05405 [Anaerolineae bacterium]|nr:hypothetical protein [Anaerolineae bacterium]